MRIRSAALFAALLAGQMPATAGAVHWVGAPPSDAGGTRAPPVPSASTQAADSGTLETLPCVCIHLMLRGGRALSTLAGVRAEIVRIWQLNGVAVVYPRRDGLCPGPTRRVIRVYLADGPDTFAEPDSRRCPAGRSASPWDTRAGRVRSSTSSSSGRIGC